MGEYVRDRVPDPVSFFESEGLSLRGKGTWRPTECVFHGGSDSLRVNTKTGGWVCMACGEKGGDIVAYVMKVHGLGFVQAARSLGAFDDGGTPYTGSTKATTLPARDAMELVALELLVATVVISGIRRGEIPPDDDWLRFLEAAGRVQALAAEYRT